MGTCASLRKDPTSSMRFKGSGEGKKVDGVDPHGNVVDSAALAEGSDFGSKDEIFFDSRGWIDSDCEDDFYSVKGDFTPSRGSTPVHPSSFPVTPRLNKTVIDVLPDVPSEPSPRKKLAQLLLETSSEEKVGNGQVVDGKGESEATNTTPTANGDIPTKSLNGAPNISEDSPVHGSKKSPKGSLQNGKVKNYKAMQCCLPSVHGFSVYEWKKHRTSPMHHNVVDNGVKASVAG